MLDFVISLQSILPCLHIEAKLNSMKLPASGGGWQAIFYTLKTAHRAGWLKLWRAMRSKNACKTCALGMGGQLGGMRNESGHFPEFCKKSLQAMASDMQGKIEERFFQTYSLEQLKAFSPRDLERAGRLAFPILAAPGDTHYRRIGWDEAFDRIAAKLKTTQPEKSFFYFSGRSSNESGFLLQLFARVYGTNHVNNCSFFCHQASGVGLSETLGTGTATVSLEDLEKTDLVFLIGGNPASNHPRLMTSLAKVRARGGHIIVINPVRETGLVNFRVPSVPLSMLMGSPIASVYLQPHIGGDIAVLAGIAKHLGEMNALDTAFLAAHTEGASEVRAVIESLSWEDIERGSGVSKAELAKAAQLYANAKSAIFAWTMGITHHEHGVANVEWIVNLALLRGMAGKLGSGLMPIRGHSNIQGLGSLGVTPGVKKAVFEKLTALGVKVPTFAGYDTLDCLQAATRGEIHAAICLGGNLFGSSPDANAAHTALSRIEQLVYLNTTLNTTHSWGRGRETIVFPVLARDEEAQATTQESMFNFVRMSDGGTTRIEGLQSEVQIVARIAHRVLGENAGPIDWQALENHTEIRKLIARIVPGFEKLAEIDTTKKEFHIPGRLMHTPTFNTPNGKARMKAHALPALNGKPGELRLMTVRSEGQFNTVVYETEDIYRGQERRDIILLNPADMTTLGLKQDQLVTVRSACGEMPNILARPFEIRAGNALMYYPEANVLVPATTDARSKTPAFKSVAITIVPQNGRAAIVDEADKGSIRAQSRELKACT